MKPLIPLLAALSLAACAATPTYYQPAIGRNAVGFSEYRLETGRYRITFAGGPGAPIAQVSDYALLRAAELTIADGYDWFRVTERFSDGRPGGNSRMSVGLGGGNYGWRSGVGLGLGTSFDLSGGPRLSSTIEVMMGRGPRPPGADVYDAQEVRRAISART